MSHRLLMAGAAGNPPLAETLARGYRRVHRGCHLGARLDAAPGGRVVRIDALTADAARLEDLLHRVGADVGSPRADVQASLLLEAYAWTLLLPLAGALMCERRVPVLAPGGVSVTLREGSWPEELVLGHTRFAALAGDPDAAHEDVVAVPDDRALADILRAQVIGHLSGPIAALAAHSGRSPRALWRSAGDRLAAAMLFASETVGDVEDGARLTRAVLEAPPLPGRPDYRVVVVPGGTMRVHARQGCCLWWRTRAATCCLTCPLSFAGEARRAA